ncbi:MAG: MBG domain-containing protein, partial [Actinomycetes bacterium]
MAFTVVATMVASVGAVTFAAPAQAGPQSSLVTNCADTGAGSLRAVVGAVSAGTTITFNVSCTTIYLYTTLELTKNVTIAGPTTLDVAIDGSHEPVNTGVSGHHENMMWIDPGVSATLTNLTFQNGDGALGGAINVRGGTLSSAYTNLRVENSTFRSNSAAYGGAIDSADGGYDNNDAYYPWALSTEIYANLTVINSTFANNAADYEGAAIDHGDNGGYGTLTVLGSTFTGNHAGFGVIDNSDDGGHTDAYVGGSVFAKQTTGTTGFAPLSWGAVLPVDLGYNISDDASFGFTAIGSVNSSTTIAASLGALADNGGSTLTVLPSSSSPAVGAIPASTSVSIPANPGVSSSWSYQLCSRTDQRGVITGGNGRCTMGAVEVAAKTSVTVTASSPSSVNSSTSVPAVEYTTSPPTVASDWSTAPTCAVYTSASSYVTALTGAQPAGTYVTHCSGGTSSAYNPTSSVNGTLTVTQASAAKTNVVVTADNASITYGDSIPSIGYTTSPSTVAGDWTIEPSCAVYDSLDNAMSGTLDAGPYVTHCSGGSSTGYTPTSYVNGTFTVNQAASLVTVDCGSVSLTYTGSALTPCTASVTGAGGLSQTGLSVDSYTNNINVSVSPGIASGSYTYPGDANHTASALASGTFTIVRITTTVSVSNMPSTPAVGDTFIATFTYAGDGVASLTGSTPTVCTIAGLVVTFTGVGTCTLTASATSGTTYDAATGSAQNVVVGQATLYVVPDAQSVTYGDAA